MEDVLATDFYSRIASSLTTLEAQGLRCFAAGCAEQVMRIVELGQADTVELAHDVLGRVWVAVMGGEATTADVVSLLLNVPEAANDDSDSLDFFVMRAISVVADSVESVTANDPLRFAASASAGALNLFADVDFSMSHTTETMLETSALRPPQPGQLESLEIHRQLESIAALREPEIDALTKARSLAPQSSFDLSAALRLFAERRFSE